MIEYGDWATGPMKETPYWRQGMSPDEYILECGYLEIHFNDLLEGAYKPLWKQKQDGDLNYRKNLQEAKDYLSLTVNPEEVQKMEF